MVSDVFDKEENRQNYVRDMLRTLTKREENVLRLYFGIDRERRLTLEEIGQDFDITQDSVKRIKNKGIRKIKHPTRSRLLTSHIDKDLMERSIKERGKLLDEFMEQLLYPPREIVEKWVIIQTHIKSKEVLEEYIEPPE
jgi:DNA-binding CsgD family transcriptional regulator